MRSRQRPNPANDSFNTSVLITGVVSTVTGSNVGASKEPGEPAHAIESAGGKSVWWSWTAPTNDSVTLDTIGSSFDTLLAVYLGTNVSNLSSVGKNDDAATNGASKIAFNAVAGTTYRIAVDGFLRMSATSNFSTANGSIVLNLWQGPFPPQISIQPRSRWSFPGSNIAIGVTATGAAPLAYQWNKNGSPITNATNSFYTIPNAQNSDSGNFTVVVSNHLNTILSSNALLTISTALITNQPSNAIVASGYPKRSKKCVPRAFFGSVTRFCALEEVITAFACLEGF